jgi:enamine deaminase RidA (YjgF/YER057c/UK114 family)
VEDDSWCGSPICRLEPLGRAQPKVSSKLTLFLELRMAITRIEPGKRLTGAVVNTDASGAGLVFLSGQVADNPKADVKGQTEDVLRKVDALLAKAGTNKSKLISAQIFVTDIRNFAAMNSAWDAWVDPNNAPARATIEARLASPELLVEIMVVAAK